MKKKIKALFKFQTPYPVARIYQITERVGIFANVFKKTISLPTDPHVVLEISDVDGDENTICARLDGSFADEIEYKIQQIMMKKKMVIFTGKKASFGLAVYYYIRMKDIFRIEILKYLITFLCLRYPAFILTDEELEFFEIKKFGD